MNNYGLYAIVLAVIIITVLATYAIKLLMQLNKQKQRQLESEHKRKQALNTLDKKVFKSVLLITRAMQAEQCDFSEGCWRISVLLDSLKTITGLEKKFPSIYKLYNEIKHLPILKERKKLTKQQRMQQDFQRMKVEAELHIQIVKDLDLLQQFTTEKIAILTTE
ncbi:MAG: DUF2489 domain-containing protein [Colwellia sp.]